MSTIQSEPSAAPPVPEVPTQLFIGGEWRDAADGATFTVISPSTEETIAEVAAAGEADVDARSPQPARSSTAGRGRSSRRPIAGACSTGSPT